LASPSIVPVALGFSSEEALRKNASPLDGRVKVRQWLLAP
jgi:hypothetical protein